MARPARSTTRALVMLVVVLAVVTLVPPGASAGKRRPIGRIFRPNPVVALGDQTLVDDRDADSPAFADAYVTVRLYNLDHTGELVGDWASVCGPTCASSRRERFLYDRSDDRFEQVMAYWAVTKAQRYLRALGIADVNAEPQDVVIRSGIDNSFYDPRKDLLLFGSGGVDDAEDMDLIWHEYGHAMMHDLVPDYGTGGDALAIGEGFGDYWAYTVGAPYSSPDPACIADWDSVAYTDEEPHCLRRVDLDLTTDDLTGQPHHDGQVWSRALSDIRAALGNLVADRIIIDGMRSFAVDVTFAEAAEATVDAARAVGADEAAAVRAAFHDRGFI